MTEMAEAARRAALNTFCFTIIFDSGLLQHRHTRTRQPERWPRPVKWHHEARAACRHMKCARRWSWRGEPLARIGPSARLRAGA
jgi:hypothetical protein